MRALRFAPLLLASLPVAINCSSDKYPDGDIGYGPCPPTNGATSSGTGATSNGTGATSSQGGKGNTPGKGGSDAVPEGGDDTMPADECGQAWSEPPDTSECDLDALEDSGVTIGEVFETYRVVSKDTTLTTGRTYKLDGNTLIEPGVTLTIEKCTKILGQSPTSALITASGIVNQNDVFVVGSEAPGRLVAVGEKNAPIVFTSRKPPGERTRKDWGGIVLAGKATSNAWVGTVGSPQLVEALQGFQMAYSWNTDQYAAEDNGNLQYLRIEYAGYDTGGSIETNGLTMAGVGSGTTISHVMVANAVDDCFEWFGGTVNADHVVAFNCDDDAFDTDYGYSGTVQFAFARQFPLSDETDSNGFESDGNKDSDTRVPYATNRFSNVTACGGNLMQTLVNPRYGVVFRQGTRQTINNAFFLGFDSAAVAVRQASTVPTITNTSVFDNYDLFDPADANNLKDEAWFLGMTGNDLDRPAGLCDCYANPPLPFPTEEVPGGTPGDGYPEPDAAYRGAFKDSKPENNWMTGLWVDWSEN